MAAPTPAELQQVADIIKSGTDVYNRDAMERVAEYMQHHSGDPKFNQCLCVIACTQGASTDVTRQQAALALKNNISRNFESAIMPVLENTKQALASALADPNDGLRNALASCVSGITKTGSWPTFVPEMWPKLKQSQDPGFRQGVLVCVRDMCEDCADQLEKGGAASQAPILITELVSLATTTASTREVLLCVEALFHLLDHTSTEEVSPIDLKFREILLQVIGAFERCITLATSPDGTKIAKFTLNCYRLLLYYYDMLKSHNKLNGILQLIYKSTESPNAEVSLAACEFWHDLSDLPEAVEDLATYNLLADLSKQLLNKMVYSDLEVSLIMAETEEEDVKPRTAKKRKEDDDDDDVEQWTIRKCAASTLDALSKVAGGDLITPANHEPGWLLTQEILPRMQAADWKVQESAVLALGAISSGCYTEVRGQLGQLVPVLMGVLQQANVHFLVRGITCWTLGRYVHWIAPQQTYFEQYLTALLTSMSRGERKVQECAVSSFAGLLEHESKTPGLLKSNPSYIQAILKHVAECLQPGKYTTRSVVILLEAIGHLAYSCGDEIATEMGDSHLMRPLLNMLMKTPEDDCVLLPQLLYCLYNCVSGMGAKFGPYVNEVYQRALTILGKFFEGQFAFKQNKGPEPDMGQNHTFAITLVKSLMDAMEAQHDTMVQLIMGTKYPGSDFTFVSFVLMCINQPQLELESHVVMTAIDIIGENLKAYPELFLEESVKAVPALLEYCNEDTELCNDCAWFCGAVVLMAEKALPPEQLRQLIVMVANKLVPILVQNEWDENLLQNVAISIGKCGLANPSDIAAHLDSYFRPLLNNLALVVQWDSTQEEKPQAFLGVIRLIEGNFAVLQNPENIRALAKGMSSFSNNSLAEQPDLVQAFTVTLQALKKALGAQWVEVAKTFSFPAPVLARLQ